MVQVALQSLHIHFVCTGNAYRSRLAETYLKSKQVPGLVVSSSGTEADKTYVENGPISWYAMRLILNDNLVPFMKPSPTQATAQLLSQADLLIFMSQEHYDHAKKHFGYEKTNYQIWEISDIHELGSTDDTVALQDDIGMMQATEKTFDQIKKNVDELVDTLKTSNEYFFPYVAERKTTARENKQSALPHHASVYTPECSRSAPAIDHPEGLHPGRLVDGGDHRD